MNKFVWLDRLIGFDTTSRNSNLDLIKEIEKWLDSHHIEVRLTKNRDQTKANLFATLPSKDGNINGGIILSGHTDVVPVDGQKWDTNPFKAMQIDDKIYGRGTSDMKGFLAVMLALVPEFQRISLKHPVHLAFSYDEEVGCQGVMLLIDDFLNRGIQPAACIVGEPSYMQPIIGHKGIQLFHCRVQGNAAHSSLTPKGCNAIDYAARLICFIRNLADEFRQKGPFDEHYDVPFTTISTNKINGGVADNIIPAVCEFNFEFRHLSQVDPSEVINRIKSFAKQELLPQMQQEFPEAAIEIDYVASVPSFEADPKASIYQKACSLSDVKEIMKVAYATEAGLFQAAKVPTIVCGPGSIDQAHRANEFVSIEQLNLCEQFLLKLVS